MKLLGLGAGAAACEGPPTSLVDPIAAAFEVRGDGALLWASGVPGPALFELRACDGDAALELPVALDDTAVGSALIDNLGFDESYHYRVVTAGVASDWGWFRTAPDPHADVPVCFAYAADLGPAPVTAIVDHMARSPALFYLNLGDWPYADDAPEALSLDHYRAKHRAARAPGWVRRLMRRFPIYAIYDDHDVRCNWDGALLAADPDRVAAGLTAWDESFPLRGPVRYRDWRWGRHLHIFVLDTRLYRSANDADDGPDKTMLGAAQKAWLLDGLRTSDASFKLIASSVPLGFGRGIDHWSSFAVERDEIVSAIVDEGIEGALFLSADRHYFAAVRYDFGVREFQVGPLASGPGNPPAPTLEVVGLANTINYGEIAISAGANPRLTFTCRDRDGAALYRETLSPEET